MKNLVSIIIPAFNAGKYLSHTIRSVISQTFSNWELIIVNDGSTDNSDEIISEFLTDKRISHLNQTNAGVSVARNNGLSKAKGAYIAFLDADDIWHIDNLEKKISALESDGSVDWVFSDMAAINEQGHSLEDPEPGKDSNFLKNILLWNGEVVPGPCSNLVIRSKCVREGLRFDPAFTTAADQDFTIQLAARFKGKRIPQRLWSYRVIGNSMSRNVKVMEKDHIGVFKKAEKQGLYSTRWFKQQCFSNLYLIIAGSWWVNGNNKWRGIRFIFLSLFYNPFNMLKLFRKKVR